LKGIEQNKRMLKIRPLPTRASKIESPPLMDEVDLKHPFSLAVYGMTGSGKTVAVLNVLTNPEMYGDYFDEVYLFSATGKSDDSFDALALPKRNVFTDQMIPELHKIIERQKKAVERKGIDKAKKVCIIFEDLTANRKLMNSPDFIKAFVQNRHLSCSTIACCHKFNALVRTARMNANHHWVFPCSESEVSRIVDEHQPPELKKSQFVDLVRYAFEPSEDQSRPFLWINLKVPTQTRFRKSMEEVLEI
jgi:hypothetical protein